jgi:hypothetical protein
MESDKRHAVEDRSLLPFPTSSGRKLLEIIQLPTARLARDPEHIVVAAGGR